MEIEYLTKVANFIVFEGIDGAGKTTQGKNTADFLSSLGYSVSWYPNQSLKPICQILDKIAQEDGYRDRLEMLGSEMELLMISVLKWKEAFSLKEEFTKPGHYIIMDRYIYSWYAYAKVLGVNNEPFLRRLFSIFPIPDIVFLMEVSPQIAYQRIVERGIDVESTCFLTQASCAYQDLSNVENFNIINAEKPIEMIFKKIQEELTEIFPEILDGVGIS